MNGDALVQIKRVIDNLKALEAGTLTETEREAIYDCLGQAYDRAAYLLSFPLPLVNEKYLERRERGFLSNAEYLQV